MENETENTDSGLIETRGTFRDSIATIDGTSGKRKWIFPRKPKGNLHRARIVIAFILLAMLVLFPIIKINGKQFVLLDIFSRKFIIFGMVFWPQDFHLFAIAILLTAIFIVVFTLGYGRIWCGWACPQTIFMEMVFRKIEYLIEGSAAAQRKLIKSPWNFNKIFRKGLKHTIFYGMSFLIGNILLAYIIGSDQLFKIISEPVSEHVIGFASMIIFSFAFYFIFAWFREQACTLVCPYARLQSVLIDKNSIVVAYDYKRGEPRRKPKDAKNFDDNGDCIDCGLCHQVCPTGIDIRNGIQLECINCTACIDACNTVMVKTGKPKKLIRYASSNNIEQGKEPKFNTRMAILSSMLVVIAVAISVLVFTRSDFEVLILNAKGTLYQERDNNMISNLYNGKFINKTPKEMNIGLKLESIKGKFQYLGNDELIVKPNNFLEARFFILIDRDKLIKRRSKYKLGVYNNGKKIADTEIIFSGPGKRIKE